jgi:hypothetical protein
MLQTRQTHILLLILLSWVGTAFSDEEALSPAPDGSFSIVVIPDTQQYKGHGTKSDPNSTDEVTNKSLEADMQWILDHLQSQRIVFVSHVGDIVDKNAPEQWEVARQCLDRLHNRVPYAIAPGNHDMKANGDCSLYQRYFPAERFAGFDWYGGAFSRKATSPEPSDPSIESRFGNNANSFQLFSASGLDFLALHLACNAPDAILHWADEILDAYPQRRAMVTTHMGLGPIEQPKTNDDFFHAPKGRMQWSKCFGRDGNTPQQMWDKCFRKHANLCIVWSGDQSRTEAMHQTSCSDHGTPIHEIMVDYNDGWLRLCRFVPKDNKLHQWTIDSRTGKLCTGTKYVPAASEHNFILDYDMTAPREKAKEE